MGILRTDRVSGLGGANAITGSVRFHGNQDDLQLDPNSDFNFGTGDYTIEAWFYPVEFGRSQMIFAVHDSDSTVAAGKFYFRSTNKFSYWSQNLQITSSTTYTEQKWYHVALVNNSGTQTIYVDGTSQGTATYSSGFGRDDFVVHIGRNAANTTQSANAYISNIRVTKGTALYTGTFTPPTTRLTKRSDTVLLACNSASDVLNEETGKTIQSVRASTNNSGAKSSRFTPNSPVGFSTTTDVGTQFGSTFDGVTTFDSQAYMVPPGGNTRERNRGRGFYMLGYNGTPSETASSRIDYINIQSQGNSIRFGDLTTNRYTLGAGSNSTRGLFTGGYQDGLSPDTDVNTIEFITIASEGNAQDFGDRTQVGRVPACASNDTRCVMASAFTPAGYQNTIDFVTIATIGNASDFGDLSTARAGMSMSCNSTTRGIFNGGYQPAPTTIRVNNMEFITFATTGNTQDFGDLTDDSQNTNGGTASSSTRGLIGLGYVHPTRSNAIDFCTIATTGNAQDFGDLTAAKQSYGSCSNSTRGTFLGGQTPSYINNIDFVTIASTGNASDFGDVNVGVTALGAAGSDSHGGLS